jgi:hypothetical protein
MEIKALKSILAIKGLDLPEDVEAANPVSEFVSKQFKDRFPDNELVVILRDLFVDRTNNEPFKTLQTLQLFNQAIVNFSMEPETIAYIKDLYANTD